MIRPMQNFRAGLLATAMLAGSAFAEPDIPLLLPKEKAVVNQQSAEFVAAVTPVLGTAARSTVSIWSGKRRLAYGTVVLDGTKILTKWSEIAAKRDKLRCGAGQNDVRAVTVVGVYEDDDIALLDIQGAPLTPVSWSSEVPALGNFLLVPQQTGKLAASGVVSVLERNLRTSDQPLLGFKAVPGFKENGVRVEEIQPGSGAEAAGLQKGDIVLGIGKKSVGGMMELKSALRGTVAGDVVPVRIKRGNEEKVLSVTLSTSAALGGKIPPERLNAMEQMGARVSHVRGSFAHAVETDMEPNPDQIGGPVADLKGHVVGITLARAGRTRAFMMPSAAVTALLKQQPTKPELAKMPPVALPQLASSNTEGSPFHFPGDLSPRRQYFRGKQHLSDLQRLREQLSAELDSLTGRR